MNDKYYVYMSNKVIMIAQIFGCAAVAAAVAVVAIFIGEPTPLQIITLCVMPAVGIVGTFISFFFSRLGDHLLLTDNGISYRHRKQEKLFIPYGDLSVTKLPMRQIGDRRFVKPLMIGMRGSLPDSVEKIDNLSSFADGWFVCAGSEKLIGALEERVGVIENFYCAEETEETEVTGEIDGKKKTARQKVKVLPRRKRDDTHDYDAQDGDGESGWRCE